MFIPCSALIGSNSVISTSISGTCSLLFFKWVISRVPCFFLMCISLSSYATRGRLRAWCRKGLRTCLTTLCLNCSHSNVSLKEFSKTAFEGYLKYTKHYWFDLRDLNTFDKIVLRWNSKVKIILVHTTYSWLSAGHALVLFQSMLLWSVSFSIW